MRTVLLYLLIALTNLIGGGALLAWLVFLYSGSFGLFDLAVSESSKLALDVALSLLFFLQHSLMVRGWFRERLGRLVPTHYHGALFTIVSGALLLAVVLFWQESAHSIVDIQGPARLLVRALFVAAFLGFVWGNRSLGAFDMFGVEPIKEKLGRARPLNTDLTIRGPYRWVRHPLYTLSLTMIWCCPEVTADRLIHNVIWTVWIFIGAVFEGRDLARRFGDDYRRYQQTVPMLIPRSLRPLV
jgi:protein-S-isoprenylcysteine O-methyltransferase Ste14